MDDSNRGKRIKFKYWDCELIQNQYSNNGRIALSLVAWEDDPAKDIIKGEPIATCTVNISEEFIIEGEVIIKDYSENEGMLQALIDADVVEYTGKSVKSGFIQAPICRLK